MRTRSPVLSPSGLALAAMLVAGAAPARAQAPVQSPSQAPVQAPAADVETTTTTTTTTTEAAPAPPVPMAPLPTETVLPARSPYISGMFIFEHADRDRRSDDVHTDRNGRGGQGGIGIPFGASGHSAFELNVYSIRRKRSLDGQRDYRKGVMLDLVQDFGTFGYTRADGAVVGPTVRPFVFLGAGVLDDNVLGSHNYVAGGELGVGVFAGIYKDIGLRLQARVVGQENDQSYERAGPRGAGQTSLVDYDFMAGLQLPLPFYNGFGRVQPTPVLVEAPPPVADSCPTRVVDPATGRSDCVGDGDADGVVDSLDQCPGTPPGTVVNAEGCPALPTPATPEPVPEAVTTTTTTTTEAPATAEPPAPTPPPAAPLEPLASLAPVRFETNSTTLDAASRETLNRIAAGLKANPGTRLQIAGHADKVGGETYNLMLGGLRAESVRQYLLDQGVVANQLTVVSYGEFDVASKAAASTRSVSFRYFGR